MTTWLTLEAKVVIFIFPRETILENICESAAGYLMKGQSKLESWTRRHCHYPFLAAFPQPFVQDQTEGRDLPWNSLGTAWLLLVKRELPMAGFGFWHSELLFLNFVLQASCPQNGQLEHLLFSLAAPPVLLSPTLVWSAFLWATRKKELLFFFLKRRTDLSKRMKHFFIAH